MGCVIFLKIRGLKDIGFLAILAVCSITWHCQTVSGIAKLVFLSKNFCVDWTNAKLKFGLLPN